MSRGLLNKFGFKCVFESDQFVLTKCGIFVGKGYQFEGVFKLNLVNKVNVFAYMIDSVSLWHNKSGHVNTRKLHDMSILNLILHSVNDMIDKCRICLKRKLLENLFQKLIDLLQYCNLCILMFVTCIVILHEEVENIL
jgi:hypothetical protein